MIKLNPSKVCTEPHPFTFGNNGVDGHISQPRSANGFVGERIMQGMRMRLSNNNDCYTSSGEVAGRFGSGFGSGFGNLEQEAWQ